LRSFPRAFRGVGRATECCVSNRPAVCWVACGLALRAVSIPQRDLPDSIVPRLLRKRVHPLVPCFSFEVPSSNLSARPFGVARTAQLCCPPGVSSAASTSRSSSSRCRASLLRAPPRLAPDQLRKHTRFRYAPSSGFLNLSTACFRFRVCGPVASRYHLQGSFRSGVSPDSQPALTHRQLVPPCCYRPSAHRSPPNLRQINEGNKASCDCHLRVVQLRGFTPRIEAFFEARV